ncbi:hypothetical protein COOONC_19485 [Cooperia oncophora]
MPDVCSHYSIGSSTLNRERIFSAGRIRSLSLSRFYGEDLEEIREMGARHFSLKQEYGLSTAELDRFQEIFVEVILKQDGVRQSKEASRAWRILICAFVDLFRDGFETQLRQFRRKQSFNAHTQYFEDIERQVIDQYLSNLSKRLPGILPCS